MDETEYLSCGSRECFYQAAFGLEVHMLHCRLAIDDREEALEKRAIGVALDEVLVVLDVVPS